MVGASCKQDHAHDGLDGVPAALEHARQPAGLALEMKAQRQEMHMLEGEHRQPPHRVHRHFGENAVAPLREQRHDRRARRRKPASARPARRTPRPANCLAATGAVPWPASASVAHLKVNGTAIVANLARNRSTVAKTTRDLRSGRSAGQIYGHSSISVDSKVPPSSRLRRSLFWFSCGRCNSLIEAFFGSSCCSWKVLAAPLPAVVPPVPPIDRHIDVLGQFRIGRTAGQSACRSCESRPHLASQ